MGVDLIGSENKMVAIVETKNNSKSEIEKSIIKIKKNHKNVKSILKKNSGPKGEFRIKKLELIDGEENTEVIHKENNYLIKIDPRKVYFSSREGTIRKKISSEMKAGEKILIMFAGVGPYLVSISKIQPKIKEVIGIENNPIAVKYMEENIRINKIAHLVTPIEGDVNEICKNYSEEFDRIIMPMVYAKNYLDIATKIIKNGGLIYIYMISEENDFKDIDYFVSKFFENSNRKYKILEKNIICLFSPNKYKILVKMEVSK